MRWHAACVDAQSLTVAILHAMPSICCPITWDGSPSHGCRNVVPAHAHNYVPATHEYLEIYRGCKFLGNASCVPELTRKTKGCRCERATMRPVKTLCRALFLVLFEQNIFVNSMVVNVFKIAVLM